MPIPNIKMQNRAKVEIPKFILNRYIKASNIVNKKVDNKVTPVGLMLIILTSFTPEEIAQQYIKANHQLGAK